MAISNNASGYRPGVCTFNTRPTAPYNGQVIYETDTKQTLVYQGSSWVMLTDADTPPGLQLIKTQTIGSAVSSVTVSDVYSSEFDVYRISISGGTASAAANILYQNGSSTTGYYSGGTSTTFSNNSVAGFSDNNATAMLCGTTFTDAIIVDLTVINPFLTKKTHFSIGAVNYSTAAGSGSGFHNVEASYTAFTLKPSSGTLTGGTIRVYGYRN